MALNPFEQQQFGTAGVEGVNAADITTVCTDALNAYFKNSCKTFVTKRIYF